MSSSQKERQEIEEAAVILLQMADPLWKRPTDDNYDDDNEEDKKKEGACCLFYQHYSIITSQSPQAKLKCDPLPHVQNVGALGEKHSWKIDRRIPHSKARRRHIESPAELP